MDNNIRKERQKKGLTLEEMSKDLLLTKKVEISADGLAKYERGVREPKLETWKKLADYFGVDVTYLQGFTQNPNLSEISFILNYAGALDKIKTKPDNAPEYVSLDTLNLDRMATEYSDKLAPLLRILFNNLDASIFEKKLESNIDRFNFFTDMQLFTISLVKLLEQPKTDDKKHILDLLIADILFIEELSENDDLSIPSFLKKRRNEEEMYTQNKKATDD